MACLFGHKWNGCKCEKCGKTRDPYHDFRLLPEVCKRKCATCGQEINENHTFQVSANTCEETCQHCGLTRTIPHIIQNDVCSKCGLSKDELMRKYQHEISEVSSSQSNYEIKCEIERIARVYSGVGDPQLLHPLCEVYAQRMIDVLEEFWLMSSKLKKASVFVSDAKDEGKALVSLFLVERIRAFAVQWGNMNMKNFYPRKYEDAVKFETIVKSGLNIPFFYLSSVNSTFSGSYHTFQNAISAIKPKEYLDSPFAFFKRPFMTLEFLGLVFAEDKKAVLSFVYDHAVSWVEETIIENENMLPVFTQYAAMVITRAMAYVLSKLSGDNNANNEVVAIEKLLGILRERIKAAEEDENLIGSCLKGLGLTVEDSDLIKSCLEKFKKDMNDPDITNKFDIDRRFEAIRDREYIEYALLS